MDEKQAIEVENIEYQLTPEMEKELSNGLEEGEENE